MKNNIRIVIVDDHPLFREGVALTLATDPSIEVIAEGQSSEDAIRLAEEHLPDVMLLDISMPGGGIEAAEAISLSCPVVKIGMLTVSEREDDVMKSLNAGASGYILKGVGGKELIDIVKRLSIGESYITPQLAARMLSEIKPQTAASQRQDVFSDLTAREEQILESISRGLSNKEIGRELNITEKTVKHYVTNVLQKLQVRNRVEAALLAQKRSLE
jgi:DNA-binding NarL/FixJ family response regulator